MPPDCVWIPPVCHFNNYGGTWPPYLEAVYEIFKRDFVESRPFYNSCNVAYASAKYPDGKEMGFWHCITEGKTEEERTPDCDRCERIGWIRPIIENSNDALVDVWENQRGSETSTLFWFDETYLIVLAHRQGKTGPYYFLKTAFCTFEKHRQRKHRADCEAFKKKAAVKEQKPHTA